MGITEAWDGGEFYLWALCGGSAYPTLYVDFSGDGTPTLTEFGSQSSCAAAPPAISDPPVISSFAPDRGRPGAMVTISGTNFADTPDLNRVYFGDLRAKPSAASTTSLSVTVPDEAQKGSFSIRVIVAGQEATSSQMFTILNADDEQDELIGDLETNNTAHGTKITDLETSQAAQDTKITDLETGQAAQDTKITDLETSQAAQDTKITDLETGQAAQDTKITDLETSRASLETSQGTQDGEITALKAKIKALGDALAAAGIDLPDTGTPAGGTATTIYNVPGAVANARVYPNPAKHTLLFANLAPGRVYVYKIYTPSGTFLNSGTLQKDKAVDISSLVQGNISSLFTQKKVKIFFFLRSNLIVKLPHLFL